MNPTAAAIVDQFDGMMRSLAQLVAVCGKLDWLGKASGHPEGSGERGLAEMRDLIDGTLGRHLVAVGIAVDQRAKEGFSQDLLIHAFGAERGNGSKAIEVMERYHEIFGDESTTLEEAVERERGRLKREGLSEEEINGQMKEIEERVRPEVGTTAPETMPDSLVWEAYDRVSKLRWLIENFPRHVAHSVRQMPGLPMMVSEHLDFMTEYREIARRLQVGAHYPLDVSRRKKRGCETQMLRYLVPMLERLAVIRDWIQDPVCSSWESEEKHLAHCWTVVFEEEPTAGLVEVLKPLARLEPLTKRNAREWTNELLVPFIMRRDALTATTCVVPALQMIWRQRDVKSDAIFRSRLQSAVFEVLKTFARAGGKCDDDGEREAGD